jgi:hypothetical protein
VLRFLAHGALGCRSTFPMARAAAANQRVSTGDTLGKIVLVV